MARPWGDNNTYQSLSGYAWLLGFAVWATLPYLMIIFLARKAFSFRANNFIVIIGALIISLGGVALYIDAAWLHRDHQGALVFIAVPLYQWIILGLLAVLLFLFRKRQDS
jgi:hypothetical protein